MKALLKKDNFIAWIVFSIATFGLSNLYLASLLGVYQKDAWYRKPIYWCLGALFMFAPLIIMFIIFYIQICCGISQNLGVSGEKIYTSPYSWIICFIIPIIGWSLGLVMLFYVLIRFYINLALGYGEKYII